MTTTFVSRRISLTFQLGYGTFGETGTNKLTIAGLRCSVKINRWGDDQSANASLRVWGLTLNQLNQLTALQSAVQIQRNNIISISAGSYEQGTTMVFQGQIMAAWADFQSLPDAILYVEAQFPTGLSMVTPAPSLSFNGPWNPVGVLASLAINLGLSGIENNGVNVTLNGGHYVGSYVDQAREICHDADINYDFGLTVMSIRPKGSPRLTPTIPLISKETGMVGFPRFDGTHITVRTMFNPQIEQGALVQIKSILTQASGTFLVSSVVHTLEAKLPGGIWFTEVAAYPSFGPEQ